MKRGLLIGKFMPPHAGHLSLIRAAQALVDADGAGLPPAR